MLDRLEADLQLPEIRNVPVGRRVGMAGRRTRLIDRHRADLVAVSKDGHPNDPPAFEVIVVDDGSRVPLGEVPPRSFPVTVVRQIPMGIAAARNRGIAESRGELVRPLGPGP